MLERLAGPQTQDIMDRIRDSLSKLLEEKDVLVPAEGE
jgi:hypothetical protein